MPDSKCRKCFKEMDILLYPPFCECKAETRITQGVHSEENINDSSSKHSPTPADGKLITDYPQGINKDGLPFYEQPNPKFSCTYQYEAAIDALFIEYFTKRSIRHVEKYAWEIKGEDVIFLMNSLKKLGNK